MKKKLWINKLILLLMIGFNFGCDQVSKVIIREEIGSHDQYKFLFDRLTLLKVENYGAFLSFGDQLPETIKYILLSLLPLMVLGYGLYYLFVHPQPKRLYHIGLCCVIGGGFGNLYDRMVYGSVTDFLHLDLEVFQTGIFNLADISISSGMVMVLFAVYQNHKSEKEMESTGGEGSPTV